MSIYRQLGVEPIINACGTVTRLGGAPLPPEVLDAFREAAAEAVSLEELHAAASQRIAAATGTEAGLVTSGAAGALTLGAAAILTKHDLTRMDKLPNCDGFPCEFVIAREQRSGYDHAVRASGAKLVEVGFNEIVANAGVRRTEVWEYAAAITSQTAGIVYACSRDSQPPLTELVTMAHQHGIPVLVDAAGELPPRSNLQGIPSTGADLICFSGGKAIRGPQGTGLLCGRSELISAAALQMLDMDDHMELWNPPGSLIDRSQIPGLPRHGIGRALKVSKEEIVALLTAIDMFVSGAFDDLLADYRVWLRRIMDGLADENVRCRMIEPASEDSWPILEVSFPPNSTESRAMDVSRVLREGRPSVFTGHAGLRQGVITIHPAALRELLITPLLEQLRWAIRTTAT